MTAHAIRVSETGGPEALEWVEVDEPVTGPGRLLVDVHAAGVNFIDTYHRSGLYPLPLPFVPGSEGAGTVIEVGPEVEGFSVGDAVAWTGVLGSYTTRLSVPVAAALPVPAGMSLDVAAALPLQGMTAHYLACDTHPLRAGDRCLVHAGAGGTGRLLVQIAKLRGAEVVATAGGPRKCELARSAGADHVIDYDATDLVEAVEAAVGPDAIDVVYDGVGAATFDAGLAVLRRRGMMVTFGNASGPVPEIAPLVLMPKSLYLTRPTLFDHITTREELMARWTDLTTWVDEGRLEVRIGHTFELAEAAEAHRALQGRATTGKILLRA